MSNYSEGIRQTIARERKAREWTLRDLAGRTGVSPSTINRFERGQDIQLSNLDALCGALGIELGDVADVRRMEIRRRALEKLAPEEIAALGVTP